MFRLPTSLENSFEPMEEWRSFHSIAEVFDPTRNILRLPDRMTLSEYHEFLERVFTQDQITQYINMCFPTESTTHTRNLYREAYLMAFNGGTPYQLPAKAVMDLVVSEYTTFCLYNAHIYHGEIGYQFAAENEITRTNMQDIKDRYEALDRTLRSNPEYNTERVNAQTLAPTLGGPFQMLHQVWANRPMYIRNDDLAYITPSDLAEYIQGGGSVISYEPAWRSLAVYITMPPARASIQQISTLLNYSSDTLRYLPYALHKNDPKDALKPHYGVELEVCSTKDVPEMIAAQDQLFFICKHDGSISGEGTHRMEMVTVPATLKCHRELWAKFFDKMPYENFDTSTKTTNGMHVHIPRSVFKDVEHIRNFAWFFCNHANHQFLYKLSERSNKSHFEAYSPFPYIPFTTDLKKSYFKCISYCTTRGAINLCKPKTVEIRLFQGIVSYATIIKNLEFVEALVEFTIHTNYTNNHAEGFYNWVKAQPKGRFPLLSEFLDLDFMMDTLTWARLMRHLKDKRKADQIIEAVNKAGIKHTSALATQINSMIGRRTVVYNKTTKQIEPFKAPTGALAAKDREHSERRAKVMSALKEVSMIPNRDNRRDPLPSEVRVTPAAQYINSWNTIIYSTTCSGDLAPVVYAD